MMRKCFKSRLVAAVMAGALVFSALSAVMPGNVALAEENVTDEVTDFVKENEEATGDVTDYIKDDTEVTIEADEDAASEEASEGEMESASAESADLAKVNADNTADVEKEFVTISGHIIGYEYDEPFEILFDNLFSEEDDVTALAKDGWYSVKLLKDSCYYFSVPNEDRFHIISPDDYFFTGDEDEVVDIHIQMIINEFVTVSGNIIDYENGESFKDPLEILFVSIGPYSGERFNVSTIAYDGKYSVKLRKYSYYYVSLPNAYGFCILEDDDGGLRVLTQDEDREVDIRILRTEEIEVETRIYGKLDFGDLKDITDGDYYDFFNGTEITFEGEYYSDFAIVYSGEYETELSEGDYNVILTGETGNVYSVEPCYIITASWPEMPYTEYLSTLVYYGDYRTRDNEARIVCSFEDDLGLDLSNSTFYFVDSDKNRTNDCSYYEIIYGLIRLPKNKTYKLVAEGLPEGYELDYGKMSAIKPLTEHCGDGRYDYTVAIKKAGPNKTLAIVSDTEDIVATRSGKKYTFKIEAEGTDLSYSWYMKKPGATKFSKAGIYTDELSLYAKTNNDGIQVYCVVKDGSGNKLVGRTATFTIDYPAPEITYPNGKEISAASGKKANFRISAKSDFELTYSWYYMIPATIGGDGKFHKAGCYTNTYTRSAGKKIDGMQAYCVVTDSNGKKSKSDVITFTLK